MNVINVEPFGYSEKAKALWADKGWNYDESSWQEIFNGGKRNESILIVRLARRISERELNCFPNLTCILSATTGLDHIDLPELQKRSVNLISLRGETEFLEQIPSTAEHTWALLMSLVRNIPNAIQDVGAGQWNRDNFRGFQLKNKTIGIIGMGRTGKKVARYANSFDMKVIYFDPFVTSDHPSFEKIEYLNELLSQSDVISLHVHLNQETEFLINKTNIPLLKSNVFMINTSRGKIWDENAIVEAIRGHKILGVSSDVLSTELQSISDSPLWKGMKEGYNILITPHIGGATWDAMWQCEEFIVKKTMNLINSHK